MFDYVTFKITLHICTLSERVDNGETWTKEVNYVSWNHKPATIDVREWNADHTKYKRGITLSEGEADMLADALFGLKIDRELVDEYDF